jgi:hypothetical protein
VEKKSSGRKLTSGGRISAGEFPAKIHKYSLKYFYQKKQRKNFYADDPFFHAKERDRTSAVDP